MTNDDRLLDLLVSRATEGLTAEEARELERLLAARPDLPADEIDLAAALADRALQGGRPVEKMPETLRRRILDQAEGRLHSAGEPSRARSEIERGPEVVPFRGPRRDGPLSPRWFGWYAAAALLVLAVWAPWSRDDGTSPVPSPAERRAELLAGAPDSIRVAWAPPSIPEYAGVTGDVVWSDARQAGFMRLRGLPPNRREVEQYQLWIVDPARDEHPVDGGVFDIPADADEVVVPIDAKLAVARPAAFAITLEQPGGVVVSDGPLLVVAPVQG